MSHYENTTTNSSWVFVITTVEAPSPTPIISDDVRKWLEPLLNLLILAFGSLGVVTNAINIRVFIKQGLSSDSSTIGLFSLAVADFMGCLFEIPGSLCPWVSFAGTPALSLSCISMMTLIAHAPHVTMSRITCWITVYIAVERSLCVLMPFKVKSILRPKVTATAMTLIYLTILCAYIPYYTYTRLILVFHRGLNATIMIVRGEPEEKIVTYYQSLIFNSILTSAAIVIVAITTFLMMYKLFASRKWRQSVSGHAKSSKTNNTNTTTGVGGGGGGDQDEPKESSQKKRELEVLKTVTMITGLFLICLAMSHIPGLAIAIFPEVTVTGANRNLFFVAYYYKVVFDVVNSSLNFFFYTRTSSRYKAAFNEVFRRKKLDSAKS